MARRSPYWNSPVSSRLTILLQRSFLAPLFALLLVSCVAEPGLTGSARPSPKPLVAGLHARQIMQGDTAVDYQVFVPQQTQPAPLPVLVVLHDVSDTADEFLHTGGFKGDATKRGYIVIAPNTNSITDPSVIVEIVASVVNSIAVDESRMLIAGIGHGGKLTLQTLLLPSQPFTAAASMAARIDVPESEEASQTTKTTPLILTYGGADADNLAQARQWAARFGCGMRVQAKNEFVEQMGWYGCRNRAEVIYQVVDGLGAWNGNVVSNTTGRSGTVSMTTLIWQFFNRVAPNKSHS